MLVKLILKHCFPYNPFLPNSKADLVIFDEDRSREGEQKYYYDFRCLRAECGFFNPEPVNLLQSMHETLSNSFGECNYVGVFTDGHCWEVEISDEVLLTDPDATVRWFAATRDASFSVKQRGPP